MYYLAFCRLLKEELEVLISGRDESKNYEEPEENGEITNVAEFIKGGAKIFEIDVKSEDFVTKIAEQIRRENVNNESSVKTKNAIKSKKTVDELEYDFEDSGDENDNEVTEMELSPLKCDSCQRIFSSLVKLKNHTKNCMEILDLNCKHCKKHFANKRNLRDHNRIFHESAEALLDSKYSFPCTECDKIFHKKSNLTSHMLRHSDEKPFICGVESCGRKFKREKTLVKHFKLIHEGIKEELLCVHCGAQFRSQSGLKAHLSIHTGQQTVKRDVPCTQCDKIFRCKADLDSHMVVHSKAKPFSCNRCNQSFSQKASLKDHENVHLEKFKCHSCGKAFGRERYLELHKKSCVHLNSPIVETGKDERKERMDEREVQHIIISSVGAGGKEGDLVQVVQVLLLLLALQYTNLILYLLFQFLFQFPVSSCFSLPDICLHPLLPQVPQSGELVLHQGVQLVVEGGEQVM